MAERDPLQEQFEAFRKHSIRTAQPPGVSSIRLALRRRRRRTAWSAVGAATLVLLALVLLPHWRHDPVRPDPATSMTPAPPRDVSSAPPSSPAVTRAAGLPVGIQ